VGTIIDARNGTVLLIVSNGRGGTYVGRFTGGIFQFTQRLVRQNGRRVLITDIRLVGGNFAACDVRAAADISRRRVVRYLKANAAGKFNVIGKRASGIERGTIWKTIDTCNSTEIRVTKGTVIATNLITRKRATVKAGGVFVARG
jgi:hypothetical protein